MGKKGKRVARTAGDAPALLSDRPDTQAAQPLAAECGLGKVSFCVKLAGRLSILDQ